MIHTDFETCRLLAREHRDQPARDSIRSLTRAEPSQIRLSQEVMR
jgi:hypothetical protein